MVENGEEDSDHGDLAILVESLRSIDLQDDFASNVLLVPDSRVASFYHQFSTTAPLTSNRYLGLIFGRFLWIDTSLICQDTNYMAFSSVP